MLIANARYADQLMMQASVGDVDERIQGKGEGGKVLAQAQVKASENPPPSPPNHLYLCTCSYST